MSRSARQWSPRSTGWKFWMSGRARINGAAAYQRAAADFASQGPTESSMLSTFILADGIVFAGTCTALPRGLR
jgi:hypothetical protein